MPAQNGAVHIARATADNRILVETIAALLLRVEAQERAGLTRSSAILAAGTEFGIDPATILHRAAETAA
jgi:hypothetical protein